jgi:hypothetical protein
MRKIPSFEFDKKPQKKSVMARCVRGAALSNKELLFSPQLGDQVMLQFLRMGVVVFAAAAFALWSPRPAESGCQLITATHSARSKAEAAQTSRALAVQSANQLKNARRWSYVTMSARRVQGDPFWKAVRPNGVPAKAQLKPDLVTEQFYTTCFTGVVVPYVCTTGSTVCGN